MANLYPVKNQAGGYVLPTANGQHITGLMSADYSIGQFYIEFFSDADGLNQVTPSGGLITVEGSPMGNVYLLAGNTSSILAENVAPSGGYEPPRFSGCMIRGRVSFSGIAGAPFARATFWRT